MEQLAMKKTTLLVAIMLVAIMLLLITTTITNCSQQQTNFNDMDPSTLRAFLYGEVIDLAVDKKQNPDAFVINDEATAIKIGEMYFDIFLEGARKEDESEAIYNKKHDVWLVAKKYIEGSLARSPVIVFKKHGGQVLYIGFM